MMKSDLKFLRQALRLARRGYGRTSPNPMVGAVLVKDGRIIGRGWHRRAGRPHAEIEALRDAQKHGHTPRGATLYVTLEPCCTRGRTPPCTDAIIAAGIKCVVVGATDPNPKHAGRGLKILKLAGVEIPGLPRHVSALESGDQSPHSKPGSRGLSPHQKLADECARLNEAFNHWIVRHTPFVIVKAAMTLDGKIATAGGESKWITGEPARAYAMQLRQGADAIMVGINTILADNPALTARTGTPPSGSTRTGQEPGAPELRRIILDSLARTPLNAKVVRDEFAALTTIVVTRRAPKNRVAALAKRVNVLTAPVIKAACAVPGAPSSAHSENAPDRINLPWLLKRLGAENITSLLVEGGGEVNASFLLGRLAQRVVFFYAPKILGGRDSLKAVAGAGAKRLAEALRLQEVEWKQLGPDLLLTARVA